MSVTCKAVAIVVNSYFNFKNGIYLRNLQNVNKTALFIAME